MKNIAWMLVLEIVVVGAMLAWAGFYLFRIFRSRSPKPDEPAESVRDMRK